MALPAGAAAAAAAAHVALPAAAAAAAAAAEDDEAASLSGCGRSNGLVVFWKAAEDDGCAGRRTPLGGGPSGC